MSDITHILSRVEDGDSSAADQLLTIVYRQLHELAAKRMANEAPGQTIQTTALVHEAYIRLMENDANKKWDGRGHFFAAAAEAMRRILVERARTKKSIKRGGDRMRVDLNAALPSADRNAELLAVHDALADLELADSDAALLVKLRYFAGFSHQEAAATLGIGRRAADRLWANAKAWLYQRIREN